MMDPRDLSSDSDDNEPQAPAGIYGRLRSGSQPETSNVHVHSSLGNTSTFRTSTASSGHHHTSRSSIFAMVHSRSSSPSWEGPASGALPASPGIRRVLDGTLPAAVKDGDDPSQPVTGEYSYSTSQSTPTALTRLLASCTAVSPDASRSASYVDGNPNLIRIDPASETTALHDHLYTRGLLAGKHSDIAVIAFGHKYNLHKIILDRAPFFTSALSGPWLESTSKEVVLHPEEIDPTITQKAFELVLKRLYGCDIRDEEDAEAVGLFAAGCWLEMQDVVDSAIESVLRQMGPETLSPLIKLVTNNYYGQAGDRILASAKAMLCRDGWEMPLKHWDDVPGDIVREIIGADSFYIPGEWERWAIAKRLLDRRLRQKARENGLLRDRRDLASLVAPDIITPAFVRRHPVSAPPKVHAQHKQWLSLYTDADVEPLYVLLDQGIHYIHLDFEQLQYIRQAKDQFGVPLLPDHIVPNALFQQMELRQRVQNARDTDLDLGLTQAADLQVAKPAQEEVGRPPTPLPSSVKGKEKLDDSAPRANDSERAASIEPVELSSVSRKFWVPSADCNIVIGGNAEPVITTNTSPSFLRNLSSVTANLNPVDALWATDFAASPSALVDDSIFEATGAPVSTDNVSEERLSTQPRPVAYSHFPPFRFTAEFPNPKSLKVEERVYSRTVFYAGSHWNIYIQKVRHRPHKNPQLGVYLHRVKKRESSTSSTERESYHISTFDASRTGTVDERIGLLEREMLLRSSDGRRAIRRSLATRTSDRGGERTEADDGSMTAYRRRTYGGADDTMLDTSYTAFDSDSATEESPRRADELVGGVLFEDATSPDTISGAAGPSISAPSLTHFPPPTGQNTGRSRSSLPLPHLFDNSMKKVPTLPPYTDSRPTIKTYFKIYSPSKGGRLLSVYESAPDQFDFSQAWGWKSSTLMLDEGFPSSANAPQISVTTEDDAGNLQGAAAAGAGLAEEVQSRRRHERERRRRKEGNLRFMVVIGNL